MIGFSYNEPQAALAKRKLLNKSLPEFHKAALLALRPSQHVKWKIHLSENLLFDSGGLRLLHEAVKHYKGNASTLRFELQLSQAMYKNYYSLGEALSPQNTIPLPVTATCLHGDGSQALIVISFKDILSAHIPFPDSLAPSEQMETPTQLLIPYQCEYDLLFANQILMFAYLAQHVKHSLRAWLGLLTQRYVRSYKKRMALAYRKIHANAQVHPTAVIEGSVIEEGAVIGAHCVVRYSHIGKHAQLHDGAKVEFSTVGERSWLMHDLVLFRSHAEDDVFLIHGPYQFSLFMSHSAAFATIMMDYRADGKPIKVMTANGLKAYQGRFLGAVLKEYAKSLGGSLLSAGIIVPEHTWLTCDPTQIHKGTLPASQGLQVIAPTTDKTKG